MDLACDRDHAARAGSTFEKILAGCWLETADPGIYGVLEVGTLDWSKVLVCDRFYALLQIRALTFWRHPPWHLVVDDCM